MQKNIEKFYEEKKKNITCEIYFIEGVQYNFKLEDLKQLLEVDDLELFIKYMYYLDKHRSSFIYIDNLEDAIETFKQIIDEDDITKEKLVRIFLKHENLFCNENGERKLELVPTDYENRIYNYC